MTIENFFKKLGNGIVFFMYAIAAVVCFSLGMQFGFFDMSTFAEKIVWFLIVASFSGMLVSWSLKIENSKTYDLLALIFIMSGIAMIVLKN
jgi:hypothetical protein